MELIIFVAIVCLFGILAMRWNVVIGGQLFSKSFLGYTTYKMGFAAREGLLPAIALMILPFFILWGLLKLLPPWDAHNLMTAAPADASYRAATVRESVLPGA